MTGEKNIVIGDFNFPNIDWTHNQADAKGRLFLETLESNFLHQMVDLPMHIRGNILDLVIVNNPADIINLEDIGNIGSSDHSTSIMDVLFENDFIDYDQQIPDWSKVDYAGFEKYLININ